MTSVARRTEKRVAQFAQYLKGLSTSYKSSKERVRRYNLHGHRFFSVEQSASLLVRHMDGKQWSGVFMNDSGSPLDPAPWEDLHSGSFFYPPVSSHVFASGALLQGDRTNPKTHPNPFLMRAESDTAMSVHDQELCVKDPFVFIADFLETSALCWSQFLSFIDKWHKADRLSSAEEQADYLRRDKKVIDRSVDYFTEVIDLVNARLQNKPPPVASVRPDE